MVRVCLWALSGALWGVPLLVCGDYDGDVFIAGHGVFVVVCGG